VGGSGSGKSWLSEKLQAALGRRAGRLSLDDFYRDRSHLSPLRRSKLNFDNPRAIDWVRFESALRALAANKPAAIPCYDFTSHCRLKRLKWLKPSPIVFVEGLWLLHRPALRRWFALSIYLDCAKPLRLRRRIERDQLSRGRTKTSILEQFRQTVEPMHRMHVAPQKRWATIVLREPRPADVKQLSERLRRLM
jgi:uridine kinase